MKRRPTSRSIRGRGACRTGAASLDFVTTLGVIATLSGIAIGLSRRILVLVYDMMNVLIAWPFL
jgi:hypothetical protein